MPVEFGDSVITTERLLGHTKDGAQVFVASGTGAVIDRPGDRPGTVVLVNHDDRDRSWFEIHDVVPIQYEGEPDEEGE